jgi:nitrogen fixation NifU-like protein
MTLDELKELGTETMIDEMGEDVVKSRVRCATLALGTVQAAADAWRKERRHRSQGVDTVEPLATFEN